MTNRIVLMDFSGVYDTEPFSKQIKCSRIDCRNLCGTDCYCDVEAEKVLKAMMSDYPVNGIHFIDSGDYHYVSKFWTDRIHNPFTLIVFDHHTDMQTPVFDNIISCGGWIKNILDTNKYIRKVIIIGASQKLISMAPEIYGNRVHFYSDTSLQHEDTWRKFAREHINEPVYISIDKDVLNAGSAATNWDQGLMSLDELKKLLSIILKKEQVIGIDICGEYPTNENIMKQRGDACKDNNANKSILKFCLSAPQVKTIAQMSNNNIG